MTKADFQVFDVSPASEWCRRNCTELTSNQISSRHSYAGTAMTPGLRGRFMLLLWHEREEGEDGGA
jgi:hypothetical protein